MPIASEVASGRRGRPTTHLMAALLAVMSAVSLTLVTMPLSRLRLQAGDVILRGVMLEPSRPWAQGVSRPGDYRGRMTVIRMGNWGWMVGRTIIRPQTNPSVELVW